MRSSYTVQKKLQVLAWHKEEGSNLSKTSRNFGIDRKRIREWISKESELQQNDYGQARKKRCLGSGRRPLSDELDEQLFEFFEVERAAGRAVSNKMLKQRAKEIADRIGLTVADKEFKASDPFVKNWKQRFNVSMRAGTNDSQKTPEDLADEIHAFHSAVKSQRQQNDYSDYNICNMDQTMVRFDCPARRTNNAKGENTIRITNTGCAKRGFTVALSASASGHKKPAFCVFKESSGRIPPRVYAELRIPNNVCVTATTNGWMTSHTMEIWIARVWQENQDDVRRLLILDKAPIHVGKEVRESLGKVDTDLILIPGGCTRLVQPADVSWNKPFKTQLTEKWTAFMRKEAKTPKGNPRKPSRQDVIDWISEAWSSISEETVRKSFKSCGLNNRLDGSENGLFHDNLARAAKPNGEELRQELVELLLDDDSDGESFHGFSDEDED